MLFHNPDTIEQMIETNSNSELLSFLASKVIEMKQDSAHYDPLGLTRVINLIAQLEKPLVVHNGILDLMFLYNSFMQPLPETVNEFTDAIHELFPHIYDTKHILNKRMQLRSHFTADNVFTLAQAFNRCQEDDLKLD